MFDRIKICIPPVQTHGYRLILSGLSNLLGTMVKPVVTLTSGGDSSLSDTETDSSSQNATTSEVSVCIQKASIRGQLSVYSLLKSPLKICCLYETIS